MEHSEQVAPIALVTGGAVRVGRAITSTLARAGYRVWLHYHSSKTAADALGEALGSGCVGTIQADLAAESARKGLAARVLDPAGPAGGRLDLLVNSAASFERGEFAARDDDDLRRVLEVNLVAPVSLTRAVAPALTAARGAVVNILDVAAMQPWPGYLDHCTAKAGLLMATKALAVELAPAVRVNGVAPGTVVWPEADPRFAEGSEIRARIVRAIPLGRIGTPDDVAETVLFLARSAFVSGQIIAVDGGRTAAGGVAGG
ncbi:SDR family oxidoreductase [Nannocystis bainbridge]|uniref:SDR family oxidoreductase n=1 Tax=Nannocystis bainbridge TaxID=2995303 RepID=A0ABT5DY93_9BACT|nr:SDR family oxidoreductase [Nannocystis bainbridge]MDC0717708.1 SDR family oxidoreductase [Nannocystis bainbridge]